MSGADGVIFNTLERATSGDQNDLQSMKDRMIADRLREQFGRHNWTVGLPIDVPENVVLGGLEVSPSGTDVLIAAGAMVQDSATVLPVPGPLDSDYRLGILRAAATETPPAPLVWHLLEAQVDRVVTLTTTRDIYDPGTETFIPTPGVDKQEERRITFQWISGTAANIPAPTGGDWVPIAAVDQTGVGLLVADIIDMRPMWDRDLAKTRDSLTGGTLLASRGDRRVRTTATPLVVSNLVTIEAEVFADPQRLFFIDFGTDVTSADFAEVALVLAADTKYYVYLAPWSGLGPVDQRSAIRFTRGVLVLSDTPPSSQGLSRNSLALTLPPPFTTVVVPPGDAVCVASLLRNAANTGWVPMQSVTADWFMTPPNVVASAAPIAGSLAVPLGAVLPDTAQAARLRLNIADNGGAGVQGSLEPGPTGAAPGQGWDAIAFDDAANGTADFWVPVRDSTTFDLIHAGGAAPDVVVSLIGWAE